MIPGERGAVAVEFALIFPLLVLILFGIFEFGREYSRLQVFEGAAREGARCAAVAATSDCNVQDRIDFGAGPYSPSDSSGNHVDATVTVGSGLPVSATSDSAGCTNQTVGQDVTVSWDQWFHISIPLWNSFGITKTITGVFRCE